MAGVALITGALSDIGRATARTLAGTGFSVAVNFRRAGTEAERFAGSLVNEDGAPRAIAIEADVRDRDQIAAMFGRAEAELGPLEVLVNNAGINRDGPFTEMTDEDWDTVLDTVLRGSSHCAQEFARRFRGESGSIVNMGAVTALKGRKNGANYCAARAGVLALTKCLALELAPRIRVNAVTPGRIDTEELQTRYRLDLPENRARLTEDVPLGRLGRPEDVARMIAYLVSSGGYVTGQNFFVDGGLFTH